jgi:hypothetical protein
MFLHNYANAIWSLKEPKCLPFFVLVTFLWQKISITLLRLQASSILGWVTTVGLVTSWFPPFQNTPSISTTNLLQVTDFWYETNMTELLQASIFDMDRFWHLVWANLTSCKFSLFFFLIPLYIFLIYDVSINKALQAWIKILATPIFLSWICTI